MYVKQYMLHYLSLLTKYDTRAALDDLVDNRVENWFEVFVEKTNPAFVDPQAWMVAHIITEFETILLHHTVKFWFKLPSIVKIEPGHQLLTMEDSPLSQKHPSCSL